MQRGSSNPLGGAGERLSSLPFSDFHLFGVALMRGAVLLCSHGADLQSMGHGLPLLCVPTVGVLVGLTLLLRIRGGALLRAGVVAGRRLVPGGRKGRGACSVPFSSGQYLPALVQVEKYLAKA